MAAGADVDRPAGPRLSSAPLTRHALTRALAASLLAAAALPALATRDDEPIGVAEPAPVARAILVVRKSVPDGLPIASPTAAADAAPSLFDRVQDKAGDMIVSAMQFIGVRYARGGDSSETGFDCSGFTRHVFKSALGLVLPRRADEQAQASGFASVPRDALQPGDLVFFNTLRREFSHVGIYIGDHRFIHAPSRGKDVRTDDLRQSYWRERFDGARRAGLFSAVPATGD